jgi:hypothetical protein
MRFEILDGGVVVNVIVASLEFVEQHYPGRYRQTEGGEIGSSTGDDNGAAS